MMAKQASTVVSTLRTNSPAVTVPMMDNTDTDFNLSSDYSTALGVNEELFDNVSRKEVDEILAQTPNSPVSESGEISAKAPSANIGKKPPSKTILKDILENTKTKRATEPSFKSDAIVEPVLEVKKTAKTVKRMPLSSFKSAPKVLYEFHIEMKGTSNIYICMKVYFSIAAKMLIS
jgi:uncharacterized protein YifN (PemK superfamily)